MDQRAQELDFDDGEGLQDEIIDEEELSMLKEQKEAKRDYRESYSKLQAVKQELNILNENVDASKDQLIWGFEKWYQEEFEVGSQPVQELNLKQIERERAGLMSAAKDSCNESQQAKWFNQSEDNEDPDAQIYKRAKASVDELHRARKFEKSIKLK